MPEPDQTVRNSDDSIDRTWWVQRQQVTCPLSVGGLDVGGNERGDHRHVLDRGRGCRWLRIALPLGPAPDGDKEERTENQGGKGNRHPEQVARFDGTVRWRFCPDGYVGALLHRRGVRLIVGVTAGSGSR